MSANKSYQFLGGILFFLFYNAVQAEITLPKIIGNNMVLQCNEPVTIWGNASPGENITVTFHDQVKKNRADEQGRWKVTLKKMPPSDDPAEMIISGSNTIKLENILVGEVWLCSGQSNMSYSMRKNSKVIKTDSSAFSPVDELQRANNPAIRIFLVTNKNLRHPDSTHQGWNIAKGTALRAFSAAGYFFAKELNNKLHRPIGIISSAMPGSPIEPWMSGRIVPDSTNKNDHKIETDERRPGKFYSAMIEPLAPFSLKGFLWYQGETNCFQNESTIYTDKMQSLIESWRDLWNDKSLPFYYVQIAPFYYSRSKGKYPLTEETLPRFWEAQTKALKISHTGMVVTTDLVATPNDLHPGFKWEVGRRLAQWALAKNYGLHLIPSGPIYTRMKIRNNKIELKFSYIGSGLVSRDNKPLTCFTIAGADGKFVPANAVIEGNKVIVSSPEVPHPEYVRFAWNEAAKPLLYNIEGLPAVPFRTDAL